MARAPQTRRAFLSQLAGAAAAMAVADGVRTTRRVRRCSSARGMYAPLSVRALRTRRTAAFQMRGDRARHWHDLPLQPSLANDDELLYPDGWANFSKALPHDRLEHPDPEVAALVHACTTGDQDDFAAIPLGGCSRSATQAGLSFEVCGTTRTRSLSRQLQHSPVPGGRGDGRGLLAVPRSADALPTEYGTHPRRAGLPRSLTPERFSWPEGRRHGHAAHDLPRPIHGRWRRPFHLAILLGIAFGAQLNAAGADVRAGGGLPEHLRRLAGTAERRAVGRPPLRRDVCHSMRNIRDLAAWVDADPPLQAAYHALSIPRRGRSIRPIPT